jgi:hypothetical protein
MFSNIVADFSRIPSKYPEYENKSLILVTADDIEDAIIATGLEREVHVLHYKSLNRLTALNPATTTAVRDLVRTILAERATPEQPLPALHA